MSCELNVGKHYSLGWRTLRGLTPVQGGGRVSGFLRHHDLQSGAQSKVRVGTQ